MVDDALFRAVVESSHDGFWVFDLEGNTVHANNRTATLLGYSPDELARMSVFDVLDDVGQEQFRQHLADVATRGPNRRDEECTYVRKDGSPIALMIGESTATAPDGSPLVVHRLVDDVGRRRLLHALSTSREQLDEAQSIARVGSWDIDLTTGEMTWSKQMFAILGVESGRPRPSAEEFVARVHPDDRAMVTEAIDRARQDGEVLEFDARVARGDGTTGWVRGRGRTSRDEDGAARYMRGTLQDISDIKEVELQLVDAVILNAMMQVMATAANAAATLQDALRVTREQLLAHEDWQRATAFRVVGGDAAPTRLEHLPIGEEEGPPTDRERRVAAEVVATSGVVFEEDEEPESPSIGVPLVLDGEPFLVIVITANSPFERHQMLHSMVEQVAGQLAQVAERERAARDLAQARDAAMEASRHKSEFLATMSHEIRTPMNGVIGLNDLLLRTELDSHQRRLAEGVRTAGRSLLGLINDILDFSKIEAGELELEKVEFDVRSTVDQVVAMLAEAAQDKGLSLAVTVAEEVPRSVVGDPTRLGQVLSNLVSNAVKFTATGGVHVGVTAEVHDAEVELRVEVADTGMGIGEPALQRLFEPFRQADASTTRTHGGTGLGLTISRQLVHAFGGDIGARSTPGEGSLFWFTGRFGVGDGTGIETEADDAAPAAPDGDHPHRVGHVLVVEDNEINQMVALGLLQAAGYSASIAANGEQALAMAAATTYDAVLMDLQMPRMDGYTAARRLREQEPPGTRVPVIAMTASAIEGERERCLEAGMDDFITKPVDSERLEAVLRSSVGRRGRSKAARPPEPARTGESPAVDLGRLDDLLLVGQGAEVLVHRAVSNFVTGLPVAIAGLEEALVAGDDTALVERAHRLRGSALNLGANEVAGVLQELETMGDLGRHDDAEEQLVALRTAARRATAVLLDHVAVRDSA